MRNNDLVVRDEGDALRAFGWEGRSDEPGMQEVPVKPKILYASGNAIEQGTAPYTHVMEVVRGLRRRGFPVQLFAVSYGARRPSVVRRLAAIVVVQVRVLFALLAARLSRGDDILYVRQHPLMSSLTIVAKMLRVPSLLEVNGRPDDFIEIWTPPKLVADMVLKTIGPCLRAASAVIVVAEDLSDFVREKYGVDQERLHVVHNGVDIERFRPLDREQCRSKLGLTAKAKIVTFVGSLSLPRGVETLLDACVRLAHEKRFDIQTLIVGGGALQNDVERMIDGKGLAGRVIMVGRVAPENVPQYVCAADVCVAPYARCLSNVSGLSPLKVYEYMACGRPVVASDFPWISGLLREGPYGVVAEPDDAAALSDAILRLLENPAEAEEMGRRGRELVEKRFTWDMAVDRLVGIMAQLCSDR